ncbi:MAG: glycosyltransferase [Phycisphaerae bacterium]
MTGEHTDIDALVTLLVWDAHEAASRLLESLARGVADRARWRLLILDQGSERRTAELLAGFANSRPGIISLHRVPENIGYPAGHNRLHALACERCSSRYHVTLNSDVALHSTHWLDMLVDFMDARPTVGIAGPTGVVYQREPPHRLGWCRLATASELQAGRFDSISGSVCIMRQAMIESIGLFDETYTPGYYEDTDLAFRAKACGWALAICPLPHAHHDLGEAQSTAHIKREVLAARYGNFQKRNRDVFVKRWLAHPGVDLSPDMIRERFPSVYLPTARVVSC